MFSLSPHVEVLEHILHDVQHLSPVHLALGLMYLHCDPKGSGTLQQERALGSGAASNTAVWGAHGSALYVTWKPQNSKQETRKHMLTTLKLSSGRKHLRAETWHRAFLSFEVFKGFGW